MSPRESEAVAVAADALDGAGDPAALVVALVAEMARRGRLPEREVAVTLARLIEEHPEGAGMVWGVRSNGRIAVFAKLLEFGPDSRRFIRDRLESKLALVETLPEPRAVARRSA